MEHLSVMSTKKSELIPWLNLLVPIALLITYIALTGKEK